MPLLARTQKLDREVSDYHAHSQKVFHAQNILVIYMHAFLSSFHILLYRVHLYNYQPAKTSSLYTIHTYIIILSTYNMLSCLLL